MSAVLDFLAEPNFWWGGLAGAVVTGVIAPLITARSVRASDRRKAEQEQAVLDRKEKREDKLRDEESLYNVAMEYTGVCTDILTTSVDTKGAFNAIRDMFYNRAGRADPKVEDKIEHATKLAEENKRIIRPYNKLRLVAPKNVLEAATQLNAAVLTVLQTTTEPLATPVALKTAGERLDNFVNVFRKEVGRDEYTQATAQKQVISFLGNLKTQVDAYMEEAKADMKAAGFKTTPWDNLGNQP